MPTVPATESAGALLRSSFTKEQVKEMACARGWLHGASENHTDVDAWCDRAAFLLGPQAPDKAALENLLQLVFEYDARTLLELPETRAVLMREGAREVLRALAHQILEGGEVDSDRFKVIITAMKEALRFRGRELFHPIRLALAGRARQGELDRVILLLDWAARLPLPKPVKGTRQRILEFCAALD